MALQRICHVHLGLLEEAIASFDKVLSLNPEEHVMRWSERPWPYCPGRYEEAITVFNRALEDAPKNVWAWCYKGISLGELNRFEEAVRSYDRVLEINRRCARAFYEKGNALARLGKQLEAVISYDQALEIEPDQSEDPVPERHRPCPAGAVRRCDTDIRADAGN